MFRCLLNGFQCQNVLLIYSKNFSIKPVIFINFQFNLCIVQWRVIPLNPQHFCLLLYRHTKNETFRKFHHEEILTEFLFPIFFLYWALWKLNCLWRAFVTACNLRVFCVFVSVRLEDSHFFDVESFSISMENNRKNSVQIKIKTTTRSLFWTFI